MTHPPQSKERRIFSTKQVATLQTIGELAAPFKLQPWDLRLGLARAVRRRDMGSGGSCNRQSQIPLGVPEQLVSLEAP